MLLFGSSLPTADELCDKGLELLLLLSSVLVLLLFVLLLISGLDLAGMNGEVVAAAAVTESAAAELSGSVKPEVAVAAAADGDVPLNARA